MPKMMMARGAAAEAAPMPIVEGRTTVTVTVGGTVAQVTYFGDYSHVAVAIGDDVRITCYHTHRSRHDAGSLAAGEACWVSWHPADCILLTE